MKKENILGLRTTIYKVPDMAAAKAWYNKALETTKGKTQLSNLNKK